MMADNRTEYLSLHRASKLNDSEVIDPVDLLRDLADDIESGKEEAPDIMVIATSRNLGSETERLWRWGGGTLPQYLALLHRIAYMVNKMMDDD